ncbi:MAG: hypothetical protein ABEL97_14370 [Salinibacter sp.]
MKDLNTPPTSDSTRTLDATVRLKNLRTGTTETLVDSVVVFNGTYTHNFRMSQPLVPGATYRLTVTRSDGQQAQATATMPRRTTVDVEPAPSDTVDCGGEVSFHFQNVRTESTITLAVAVFWNDRIHWTDPASVPRKAGFVPWRIVRDALPEYALPENPEASCLVLDKSEFRIVYTHYGPDWPADSVLADPTASTVKEGLGVFGGFRSDTLRRYVDID